MLGSSCRFDDMKITVPSCFRHERETSHNEEAIRMYIMMFMMMFMMVMIIIIIIIIMIMIMIVIFGARLLMTCRF